MSTPFSLLDSKFPIDCSECLTSLVPLCPMASDFRLPELVACATDSGVEDGEAEALLRVGDVVAGVCEAGDGRVLAGEENIEFVHMRGRPRNVYRPFSRASPKIVKKL